MKILIAEDDGTNRLLLVTTLKKWGHEVMSTRDGSEAWSAIREKNAPHLAILDWMMLEIDGVELCKRIRADSLLKSTYIIMLTARDSSADLVEGLEAGADDCATKPVVRRELQARIEVGQRVLRPQSELANRVKELEESIAREKHLQGLLPICSYCKKVRDDSNYWQQVEAYIETRADVAFSHSICPDCFENVAQPEIAEFEAPSPESGRGRLRLSPDRPHGGLNRAQPPMVPVAARIMWLQPNPFRP